MPCLKSKAQVRKLFALEERGELPKGTAERMAHETKKKSHKSLKKLPEKAKNKKEASVPITFETLCHLYAFVKQTFQNRV